MYDLTPTYTMPQKEEHPANRKKKEELYVTAWERETEQERLSERDWDGEREMWNQGLQIIQVLTLLVFRMLQLGDGAF